MPAKDGLHTAHRMSVEPCYNNTALRQCESGYSPNEPLLGYRVCAFFYGRGAYLPSGEDANSHRYIGRVYKSPSAALEYAQKIAPASIRDNIEVQTWDEAKREYEAT